MRKPTRKEAMWMAGHPIITVVVTLILVPVVLLVLTKRAIDRCIMRLID